MDSSGIKSEIVLFKQRGKNRIEELSLQPLVMIRKFSKPKIVSAQSASPEIFRTKGLFPFDFSPDELIIEERRLILKRNFFPFVSQITTIPISKLSSFEITHSIFFSSIFIKWGTLETTFQWLKHDMAQQAKEIMDGIRLRDNESLTVLEQDEKRLIHTFQMLGQM